MEADAQTSNKDNNSQANDSDALSCDLCGIPYIHKNDYEKHVSSRCHKKRLRQKERERSDEQEEKFECVTCGRKLRGLDCYNAHLGSKTHKRNLRKYRDAQGTPASLPVSTQINRSSRRLRRLSISDHIDDTINDFHRKKYVKSDVRIEDLNYKTYIYSLAAFLTLRLAFDPNVEDFMISVDDKEWNVFGNVVIHIFSKEKKITYAIQCKRLTQTFRQISDLQEAKVHLSKQYNYISQLRDKGKDITETKFIILTTWGTVSNFKNSVTLKSATLNKWKTEGEDIYVDATIKIKPHTKRNEIVNVTGDPENIYSFILSDNLNCRLPHLFLYTGQRIFPSSINQLLKLKFDKFPDISSDYTKYIENWVEGRLGGNYKLKKKDVVLKIGELLLKPFTVSPKKINSKHNAFALWNQIISRVDLTVVKNEAFVISKICEPLNMIIEETLSTTIDTIIKTITLKKGGLSNVQEPIKTYFFEIGQKYLTDDIPLHLVYNIFWKAGRIPLLMSTEGQEDGKGLILDVISFMKQMGVHKKFLIKSADLNLRLKENIKIFTSLDDVKDLVDWNEVTIRVNENFQLSLNTIQSSDPFFFKRVTPNIFFDIALGKYSLKSSYFPKKNQTTKDALRLILNDDVKDELQNQLYPETNFTETDAGRLKQNRLRGIDPGIF